jgi:cytochrome c2
MRRGAWAGLAAVTVVAVVGGGFAANQIEARQRLEARVRALTGGDPDAGRAALMRRPCKGCHEIPGIPGAKGKVGPPLTGFSGRAYIGGRLENTPDNLVSWIVDPHATDPQTAMPATGVGAREAHDIAAYLYMLR